MQAMFTVARQRVIHVRVALADTAVEIYRPVLVLVLNKKSTLVSKANIVALFHSREMPQNPHFPRRYKKIYVFDVCFKKCITVHSGMLFQTLFKCFFP